MPCAHTNDLVSATSIFPRIIRVLDQHHMSHRFYGTVYRPKLETLVHWRLLRRNWKLLCFTNTSV